ncbi:MAG: TonB-dependent receptor [Gemmatimonadaceae bacterium]
MPAKHACCLNVRCHYRPWLLLLALLSWAVPPNAIGAQVAAAPLDTVTIVGSRTGVTDAGRTVEVISHADIARSSARNLAELLALRAGTDVYARSPAQADLSLRGSTSEQTLILVDGVRVSDAQSSHYALDLAVPLDAIERVEVLKGSASSLYGADAIGGVINIVTSGGAGSSGMRVRGGAWGTSGASAQLASVAGGWTAHSSLEAEKADGWRPGSDHRIGAARVSIAGAVGNDSVRVHLGTGVRSFGANAFYGAYNSRERTGATTADASWTRRHAAWLLTLGASTRYHTDRFTLVRDHPAIYENLHQSWQTGAQVSLRRTVAHGALSLAADATNHQLVSTRLGSRHEWREGAAAQVTWLTDAMTLDVGARADQSSTNGGFL